jgi:hypothetical protein
VGFPRHSFTSCSLCGKLLVLEMAKSDAASPYTRNATCSTFFPIQRTSWTIRTRCQGTKGKAAGQMRNSLLRKQRNRGALQEQVSPEFASMICVLLTLKFRFKARLSGLRTQTVKLGKHAPRVSPGTFQC